MDKVRKTVPASEEDQISRSILVWINSFQNLPDNIDLVRFEYLPSDVEAMALSTIQAAYITQKYILGGYQAEYQFKLIYRVKPGTSNDKRLKADETLNEIADFMSIEPPPDIGAGKRVMSIEATTRSSVFAMYENGDEDHQILMKLNYEVI